MRYEELLRWLVNKPHHIKPKLGEVPKHISEPKAVDSVLTSKAARAEKAFRDGNPIAGALFQEFGEALTTEFESLEPIRTDGEPFDETLVKSIEASAPYIRQFRHLVLISLRFSADKSSWELILSLIEKIGQKMFHDGTVGSFYKTDFDFHKFITHLLFLNSIALALRELRFDLIRIAVNRRFLFESRLNYGDSPSTKSFTTFRQYIEAFEIRNERLKLNRISVHADIIEKQHTAGSIPSFDEIMQADFVLFLAGRIGNHSDNWYPATLVLAERRYSPFSVFARAEVKEVFINFMSIFGMLTKEEFTALVDSQAKMVSGWSQHSGLNIQLLSNLKHLGSK